MTREDRSSWFIPSGNIDIQEAKESPSVTSLQKLLQVSIETESAKGQSQLIIERRKVESDAPLLGELSCEAYVGFFGGLSTKPSDFYRRSVDINNVKGASFAGTIGGADCGV